MYKHRIVYHHHHLYYITISSFVKFTKGGIKMIKIISSKNLCLVGKANDVFTELHRLSQIYNTLEEVILDYQGKQQQLYQQLQVK